MKKVRINATLRHKLENYVRALINEGIDPTPLQERFLHGFGVGLRGATVMASTRAMGRDGATLRVWGWDGSSLEDTGLTGAEPLGFAASDTNLYRYVHNDPTDLTDPSGLIGRRANPQDWRNAEAELERKGVSSEPAFP